MPTATSKVPFFDPRREYAGLQAEIKRVLRDSGFTNIVRSTLIKAAGTEKAYQDFCKNDADYNKLVKARDDARTAYNEALETAKTNATCRPLRIHFATSLLAFIFYVNSSWSPKDTRSSNDGWPST